MSESEHSDDEALPQEIAAQASAPAAVKHSDEAGLKAKLKALILPSHFKWVESLDVISIPLGLKNVNDDTKREAAFYDAALGATRAGVKRLEDEDIPFMRPNDFFAEMLKPDAHMARIKDKLLNEKKRMTAVEERIKYKAQKKYSKQVRAEKQKQKGKEKKEHLAEIAEFRKKRKGRGDMESKSTLTSSSGLAGIKNLQEEGGEGGDGDDGGGEGGGGPKKKGKFNKDSLPSKSKKRQHKDKKFGFGGKKRGSKKNDAKSAGDMSSFDSRKNNDVRGYAPGESFKGKKKKGKPKRPGKNKRQGKK